MIAGLRDLGKTVLLTTHYMDEAQELADRVAVIAAGEIIATGTPDDLGGRATPTAWSASTDPGGDAAAELPRCGGGRVVGQSTIASASGPAIRPGASTS